MRRLRRRLRRLGLALVGFAFPVEAVVLPAPDGRQRFRPGSLRAGVRALLLSGSCLRRPALAFAVTASDVEADIDRALAVLDAERPTGRAVR